MSKHLRTLESVLQLPVSSMTAPSLVGWLSPSDCEVAAGYYLDLSLGREVIAPRLKRKLLSFSFRLF